MESIAWSTVTRVSDCFPAMSAGFHIELNFVLPWSMVQLPSVLKNYFLPCEKDYSSIHFWEQKWNLINVPKFWFFEFSNSELFGFDHKVLSWIKCAYFMKIELYGYRKLYECFISMSGKSNELSVTVFTGCITVL